MKIISVVNQKGGVGKTTTSINIATSLAAVKKKTLLVDLDPQANASTGVGLFKKDQKQGVYEYLCGIGKLRDLVIKTKVSCLDLLASSINLVGAEVELIQQRDRESFLKKRFISDPPPYDYVILDCPPSLGLLTLNALVASHSILIPLQCEFYALDGLSRLMDTVSQVRGRYNKDLSIEGILMTMYDKRNSLANMVVKDVEGHFKELIFKTLVPRNAKVSESPSHGYPILIYDIKCPASMAYMRVAGEILMRETRGQVK